MSTKTLLISSVLFGFLLSAAAGQCFADASAQFKQADGYKQNKQYEQAEAIYQQIVTDFPDSNDALEAQKQLTLIYIATDSQPQADAALQQLLVNFSTHKDIAQAVHDIAYQYRLLQKYEKSNQIDQYVVDNWPVSDYAVLGQMDLAKHYVDRGDDPNAEAAVDKLLADFSNSPLIARAVHDVAQHYRGSRKYGKANQLYQYVIDNWPEAEHALWSQADLIKSHLSHGDETTAEGAVNRLLADFIDNPLIARAVWDTEVPIVDTRKVKTHLLLKDGQVVILGGLRRQETSKEVDQIPILGDLPIIGELFKNTKTIVKNAELIVFLSPHIYKGEPISEDAMEKFNEINDRPVLSLPKDKDAKEELLPIVTDRD